MRPVFYFDELNRVILHPDCAKLCPELRDITEEELLFLILAFDAGCTIYKQFPQAERIRKAMIHVWDDNNPKILESARFKLAIEAYKGITYDRNIALIERLEEKIEDLTKLLLGETSSTGIKNIMTSIKGLKSDISDLQNEVLIDTQNKGQIKAGAELTILEEILASQKLYKSITEKK